MSQGPIWILCSSSAHNVCKDQVTVAVLPVWNILTIFLWPLINKAFSPARQPILNVFIYLFFLQDILCKLYRLLGVKIPRDRQFQKYSSEPVWHQHPCQDHVYIDYITGVSVKVWLYTKYFWIWEGSHTNCTIHHSI